MDVIPASWLAYITKSVLILGGYRKQVINKNFNRTNINKHYKGSATDFYKSTVSNIARVMVESIRSIPNKKMNNIKFSGIKELDKLAKETTGVLLLASHFGNWELACSLLTMHTNVPIYGVYKPLKNQSIDSLLLDKRSKYGLHLVPMKRIGRVILENKKANKPAIYILISDQNPNSKNSIVWTDFLGIKSAFFNGPLKLYQKYGFNVAYMNVEAGKSMFDYSINVSKIILPGADGSELIPNYASMLESQIVRNPQYWLWSHKRWKRSF